MRPLLLLSGLAGVAGLSARARADEPLAECAVRLIEADPEADSPGASTPFIDPKITNLKEYLTKAPFTSWKQFKLVDEKHLRLGPHAAEEFSLPNGRQASITYVDHLLREDHKHRLRLRLTIHHGPKQVLDTVFVLDEGGVVLQAGQKCQKGRLILGISCEIPH
jgi:hypothetical protein